MTYNVRLWLKKIRESHNMTQEQVAKLSKISRTMLTDIENGKANPSVNTAKKIAATLDFNWTKFFDDEEAISKEVM